jgi:hypothetical protein
MVASPNAANLFIEFTRNGFVAFDVVAALYGRGRHQKWNSFTEYRRMNPAPEASSLMLTMIGV